MVRTRTPRRFALPRLTLSIPSRLHQVYYIFGVLFVVFGILVVTCAEITLVLIYFQLCSEDYRWWWRAFFTSGSSALYLFLYSAFYFVTKLEITKLVSTLMYFGTPAGRCAWLCAHEPDSWPSSRLHADPERVVLLDDRCAPAARPHAACEPR